MRLRLLTGRAGDGWSQQPGDVIEADDDEGRRMVLAGQAETMADAQDPPPPLPPQAGKKPAPGRKRTKRA